ncbi:MAG TPA: hypothetical protein VJQ46_09840 [Gemmatimonadales bacterium]|nr:hypothetical protein [Gemmatimonadales bacterium]
MLRALSPFLVTALLAATAGTLAAQTTALSPSPTLPSDTLEANYGPRGSAGPAPGLVPTLPSDTLEATQPVDSFPADSFPGDSIDGSSSSQADPDSLLPDASPVTPGDSAALRELKAWIRHHPELTAPPPARAVLVKV